jgi:hypothetical protein
MKLSDKSKIRRHFKLSIHFNHEKIKQHSRLTGFGVAHELRPGPANQF